MTVDELTLEILAERALSQFDSKRLVEWSINVLQLGYESENLYVLAGLDFDSTEEREEYFWKSIEDLKVDIERTNDELIDKYALTIATKVIEKKISIDYAFSQMLKIVSASDYDSRYIAFYEIDEDLDYLKYDNSVLFNSGLSLSNYKDYILEEFKIFLEMERLKIPKDGRNKSYCENCKNLTVPMSKNKYSFKKPHKHIMWCCSLCGSEKLLFNSNHTVKRIIIDKYKQNYA